MSAAISQVAKTASLRQSYYRSQLYTATIGVNPLVTAAHPVFSIIERIKLSRSIGDAQKISPLIEHELAAFNTRAQTENYDEETCLVAQYLLKTVLEEVISDSLTTQSPFCLTSNVVDDTIKQEKFFDIVERVINKPNNYLDLIELIYLCLNTGYQGKYRKQQNKKALLAITEKIYQTIRQQRPVVNTPPAIPEQYTKKVHVSWYKVALLSGTICICGLIFSNYLLDQAAERLLSNYSHTEQP